MVPGNSDGIPRVPPYSGTAPRTGDCLRTGPSPSAARRSSRFLRSPLSSFKRPYNPGRASPRSRFGLLPVRSPLLGESLLLSSPGGTKMFQFPPFASRLPRDAGIAPGGLPHSDIRGSTGICPSPRLFAACHVLPRLREPRHPPCALVMSRCIFDDAHHNICPIRRTPQTGDSTSASCLALCLKASIPFQSIETLVCSTLVICLSSRPGPLFRSLRFQHVIVLFPCGE